tara:strand:+ start:1222 stop:4356 length:3135 start_codon:yes stop_codon:yes gene_type:complete
MSNIVGNPFRSFVTEQINTRQEILSGSGSLGGRDERFLKYVSKTPWLRMASAVDINDRDKLSSLNIDAYGGSEAAKQFVLQGGTLATNRVGLEDKISYTSLGAKFGVATDNSIINQNSYGFGGSDFGKTPMPGLTSVTVEDYNRGAIRKAKVDFTCTNLQQFEIINTLYMRVGYNVLIEWGHSVYLDNENIIRPRIDFNTPAFTSFFEGKSTSTLLENIRQEVENTDGNYDAFMGRITNFNWKFTKGVYECSVTVLTQGDVIESLKVNTSFNITTSTEVEDPAVEKRYYSPFGGVDITEAVLAAQAEAARDATVVAGTEFEITEDLKDEVAAKAEEKSEEETEETPEPIIPAFIKGKDSNIISNIIYNNYVKLTANQQDNDNTIKSGGFTDFLKFADGNNSEYFYISLGALLSLIESNNLLYDSSAKSPIINIDSNYTTNFCARFPEQVSTHWDKCYIPYKVFNAKRSKYTDNPIIDELLGTQNKRYDAKNYTGRLMCILINANFVNSLLVSNTNGSGDISIKDFLGTLLEEVQNSIGGINDFQIGYDYTTNSLKIYDNSPLVCSQLVGETKPEVTKFQSYGVQKGQAASFLLDLNIESSLSSDIANMLAAGAQTNGNQIGENATAFSLWNQGLIDRVRKTNLDKQTFDNSKNEEVASSLQQQFLNNKDKIYNILRNINSKVSSNEDLRACSAINRNFSQYYLGEATKSTIGNTKMGLPGNFFIPFNLGLKMDGLSGMRLFDAFSITNEVLPSLYTDALQFIINGINHSITDAGWTTSLSSQTYTQFEATGNANEYPTEAVTTRGEADVTTGDLLPNFAGDTPNADFLRKVMEELGIVEKLQGDNGLGTIQAGEQISNGGDITKELAFASVDLFRTLTPAVKDIVVTAGNDLYHQTKGDPTLVENPKNSLHRSGFAIDFTSTKLKLVVTVLNRYVRGNDLFNYINEYVRRTENGTGDHFHITYGLKAKAGTFAGLERDEAIKEGKILEAAIGTDALKPTPVIIPFKDIQKEYNAFIKKREQDFQSKKATEQATSFIPKSKRGRI